VRSDSPRARESFRRSLENDGRFERLDAPGFRFRRRVPRQVPDMFDDANETAARGERTAASVV
jgi:hypothetical protein